MTVAGGILSMLSTPGRPVWVAIVRLDVRRETALRGGAAASPTSDHVRAHVSPPLSLSVKVSVTRTTANLNTRHEFIDNIKYLLHVEFRYTITSTWQAEFSDLGGSAGGGWRLSPPPHAAHAAQHSSGHTHTEMHPSA